MLRRVLSILQRPLARLLIRTVPADDPWRRLPLAVPLRRFGSGAFRDFAWYLEGESRVRVGSVEEVQRWLLGCRYGRDPELFNTSDFWQHPRTFEYLRCGDCEDFALWAWRKLIRLGYDAELVAGQRLYGDVASPHAWVLYRDERDSYLFDAVVSEAQRMIRPLDEVRHRYLPEVSVDGRLRRYVYGGYLQQRRVRSRSWWPLLAERLPFARRLRRRPLVRA